MLLAPIRLHVDAKRCLCPANADYYVRLSKDSKHSLVLQGGIFDALQAAAVIDQPGARDAVQLRKRGDLAKQAELVTPSLAHFLGRAARCSIGPHCK